MGFVKEGVLHACKKWGVWICCNCSGKQVTWNLNASLLLLLNT